MRTWMCGPGHAISIDDGAGNESHHGDACHGLPFLVHHGAHALVLWAGGDVSGDHHPSHDHGRVCAPPGPCLCCGCLAAVKTCSDLARLRHQMAMSESTTIYQ